MADYKFYHSSKECKQHAKDALRGSWKQAVGATVVFLLVTLLFGVVYIPTIFVWWASIPASVVFVIFETLLAYGYSNYFFLLLRGEDVKIKTLFSGFSKKAGIVLKTEITKMILSVFWLVLLVVPCIVKNIGYSMATFAIADNKVAKGQSAIKESKRLMKQNYGRYFKFNLSFFWWFLLFCITGGIAGLWILPFYATSNAAFYENLKTDF